MKLNFYCIRVIFSNRLLSVERLKPTTEYAKSVNFISSSIQVILHFN